MWGMSDYHDRCNTSNMPDRKPAFVILIDCSLDSYICLCSSSSAQVLAACMRCPGVNLLTNDNIISIFQACFRIGHYPTERSKDMSGNAHATTYTRA